MNNEFNENIEIIPAEFTEYAENVTEPGVSVIETPSKPQKSPKKRGGMKLLAGILAMAIVGGAAGVGGSYAYYEFFKETPSEIVATVTEDMPPVLTEGNITQMLTTTGTNETDLTAMFEAVTPTVTFITAAFESGSPQSGTGIVMTEDGYIVTNAHVIQQEQVMWAGGNDIGSFLFGYGFGSQTSTELVTSEDVTVTMSDEDNTEYKAKVVGYDTTTDLAVLKIDAKGLTAAKIGNSDKLKIGASAFTLGYPVGVGLSASDGIISGLDREIGIEMSNGIAQNIPLIQTTAAINPGNSGGPLMDSNGYVIGITSSKLVASQIEGVGFAIPITTALPIINELMTTGTYVDVNGVPKIGIVGSDLSAMSARYYGLPVETGVLVSAVDKDSAADKAGIKSGDIIVGADGEEVTNMETLNKIKNTHKVGEEMTLTLARDGGNEEITITLGS
ncbi:MAG: trypsin-like peptidase domain-containing protein [Ruminococcus sp.]|jgi:serine protease Do|nr:trypsin-like peptidase domain-containing protein [Ruminococcus sp.]